MSSSGSFEYHQALSGILQQVHREAALKALRSFGLAIEGWDTEAIGRFDPDDDITEAHNLSLGDIHYTDVVHKADILGHSHFRLKWSGTPLPYLEQQIQIQPGQTFTQHAVVAIDAPPKVVHIDLSRGEKETPDAEAMVFVSRGILPVAAYTGDLYAAADPHEPDDIRLIGQIASVKGQEALDYLSEDTCQMLGAALLSAETRVYMDESG